MKNLLAAAALLLSVHARSEAPAAPAPSGAGGETQAADKQKELPKPEIEKKQDTLKNDKRFDAYQKAVGKKADDLKRRIDECKTEACFEEAGRVLETQKQADFRQSEPSAPRTAGETDASRDAFYKDGGEKMGRAPQAAPASLEKDALALKNGTFDQTAPGAGKQPLNRSLTPLSDHVLGKDQPVRDLKAGAAAPDGKPIEQAPAQPSVDKDSARPDVAKAQGELNAYRRKIGLGQLKQDGLYGPRTTQAVKDIQEKFGLEKTGVYDAQTKEALARRLSPEAAARDALGPGSHGPEVRELQRDLAKHGIKTGTDGVFGAQTRKSLAEFQRQNGLDPTGMMDAKTRAALDAKPKGYLAKAVDETLSGAKKDVKDLLGTNGVVKETALSRGTPNNGSLKNASHLPGEGPGYEAYRSEKARYGTNRLVNGVKLMGEDALKDGRPPIEVGDMSLKNGGDIGGHASHENGKDVDLKVYGGADGFNAKQNWHLVESAINNPQFKTQYIFTSAENKAAVLAVARQELGGTNSSTYIRAKNALTVWPNHDDHFHIRIY